MKWSLLHVDRNPGEYLYLLTWCCIFAVAQNLGFSTKNNLHDWYILALKQIRISDVALEKSISLRALSTVKLGLALRQERPNQT
jgi:hypothetical protein